MLSLVTGGCGFIGSNLVKRLLRLGHKVIIIDNLSTGKIQNIPIGCKNFVFYKEDITNYQRLRNILRDYAFDYIFHLAAIASVQKSVEDPVFTHEVNVDATLYLLEEARKQEKLKRFVFSSSAAVYGDEPTLPKREDSLIKPLSPYGLDKYCAEQFVVQYHRLYGLPTVALRYFNVYGPNQDPSSPYSGVISIFLKEFLEKDIPEIRIYGDGTQTRDFIYVEDVIEANLLVASNEKAVGEVFNVGTGIETSILDLVKIFENLLNKKALIKYYPQREGDIKRSVASIEKICTIGFMAKHNVVSGLKNFLRSF